MGARLSFVALLIVTVFLAMTTGMLMARTPGAPGSVDLFVFALTIGLTALTIWRGLTLPAQAPARPMYPTTGPTAPPPPWMPGDTARQS